MWLNVIFPFAGHLIVAVLATENCHPKTCARGNNVEKPVCGSDGFTYPNRCIFEKIRCQNKDLVLLRRGPCKQQRACSDVELKSGVNSSLANIRLIPNCRPDGTYDSEQCHTAVSTCWCVTPAGIPLPYTSWPKRKVEGKSRCHRRKTPLKRSPMRANKHKNRVCKRPDKSVLNNNLINTFHSEFSRYSGQNDSDTAVIAWKFRLLDHNGDDILDKVEYKDLKKVVKKAIKPKKCAKLFPRSCDVDRNGRISLQEWDDCLTRDGMDDGRSQNTFDESGDIAEDYEEPLSAERSPPHGGEFLSSAMSPVGNYDDESIEAMDDPTDCLSDRKTALAEGSQLYVPECTPDGRYQKIQCYKSAGYCWCVNEDTGKNIPGTSVKNGTPKCDYPKTALRTMKGCPDHKKAVFLRDLLNFLHTKMAEMVSGTTLATTGTKEEQAATWSFVVFDKNKNKMLERSEWKDFKDLVGGIKGLKKCGKKLPRYCDSNKDRQISMTEWLECLKIHQQGEVMLPSPISSRAGKINPLSMLKDD